MADVEPLLGARAFERSAPAAADAVAFTGGLGIAAGVLLLTGDLYAHDHGRWPGVALFAVLVAVGYLALSLLPRATHPAAVTLIVAGVPGAFGWWLLPKADEFADIRPFLILTILAWAACFVVPRTRGRTVFVGAALLVLWLWMLGEVAGRDAYSAAPVPSPPAHTMFSLSVLRTDVTIGDLDPNDPLFFDAIRCNNGDGAACDTLYDESEPGSDFEEFADTCGNTQPAGSGDRCAELNGGFRLPENGGAPYGPSPSPFGNPRLVPGTFGADANDKSLEIGLVSLLFGVAYVGALFAFDRRRWRGLGTALVVPGILALFTGTEVLGNAAHHVWVGGLLTFVAGIAFALVGDVGGRRFSAWAGGIFAAVGTYSFMGDVTNFKKSFSDIDPNLARPAFITIGFGALLVGLAWLVAQARANYAGPSGPATLPPSVPPAPEPPPFETASPAPPAPSPWAPPAGPPPSQPPWQPPPAPPAAPPSPPRWEPPPVPPPSPPWRPPPPAPPEEPG